MCTGLRQAGPVSAESYTLNKQVGLPKHTHLGGEADYGHTLRVGPK